METIRLPLVKEGNAESKEQIAWTDEAEPGTECPQGHGRSQTLHDRVAQLLRDSIHEAENAGMGWVAASKNPNVHLEAMKEAEQLLIETDAAALPMYQQGNTYLINQKVSGIETHSVGVPFIYKNATIEEKKCEILQ
mgnify:CR=1 FL=1